MDIRATTKTQFIEIKFNYLLNFWMQSTLATVNSFRHISLTKAQVFQRVILELVIGQFKTFTWWFIM